MIDSCLNFYQITCRPTSTNKIFQIGKKIFWETTQDRLNSSLSTNFWRETKSKRSRFDFERDM